MAFSKNFARNIDGSNYPVWEEVCLTEEEEKNVEDKCKKEHFVILDECLRDARVLAIKHGVNSDEIISRLSVTLFEKRASHVVFWKENKAKEKFDKKFKH